MNLYTTFSKEYSNVNLGKVFFPDNSNFPEMMDQTEGFNYRGIYRRQNVGQLLNKETS